MHPHKFHLSLNSILSLIANFLLILLLIITITMYITFSNNVKKPIQIANNNIIIIDIILQELYKKTFNSRRVGLVIFSNNEKINKPLLTVIHDVTADDVDSVTHEYINVPISDKATYYKDLINGKCVFIKTEELSILTEVKKGEEVTVLAAPINTPFLIGEVAISFDKKHKMIKDKEFYCDHLRETAIKIGKIIK